MWHYDQTVNLDEILASEKSTVIIKHSNRCSISSLALNRILTIEKELNTSSEVVLLDVVANRDVARKITADLGITHESPQVIIISDGEVVYQNSHMSIRPNEMLSHL